jgi:hypothetical protein
MLRYLLLQATGLGNFLENKNVFLEAFETHSDLIDPATRRERIETDCCRTLSSISTNNASNGCSP